MSYERSKAPLALMEQIIMILVFALTAAVCLQAFVYSNNLSEQGDQENLAASHAQEVVEHCKMLSGDLKQVQSELQGELTEDGLRVPYENDHMMVVLTITGQSEFLTKAKVSVQNEDHKEIFAVDAAWQRGGQL